MGRTSIKYVNSNYGPQVKRRTLQKVPRSSVVYGNFPAHSSRKSAMDRFNKFLMLILFVLVLISAVSYYFVSDSENKMNGIGREIVALTNENIELQNKIDNLHSFNKVDNAIHNKTMLDTAKKVIEIPASNVLPSPKLKEKSLGHNWAIGY